MLFVAVLAIFGLLEPLETAASMEISVPETYFLSPSGTLDRPEHYGRWILVRMGNMMCSKVHENSSSVEKKERCDECFNHVYNSPRTDGGIQLYKYQLCLKKHLKRTTYSHCSGYLKKRQKELKERIFLPERYDFNSTLKYFVGCGLSALLKDEAVKCKKRFKSISHQLKCTETKYRAVENKYLRVLKKDV